MSVSPAFTLKLPLLFAPAAKPKTVGIFPLKMPVFAPVSVKVDGAKLDLVYDFTLSGAQLRSTVTGKFDDPKIEGTYSTAAPDGSSVDGGTFKVTREK